MRKILFLFVFTTFSLSSVLALPNSEVKSSEKVIDVKSYKKQERQKAKIARKQARLEKKIQKWADRKGVSKEEIASSVWDDDTFRLGAIVALGGLLVGLLGILPILGGLFSFIGALLLIAGLGIMLYVLIDSSY